MNQRTDRRRGLRAAACAALLAAPVAWLAPGTAAASSIVYVKDHNVWLTSPDGARQQPVTTDGTASRKYIWPSQADDGTILAKLGDHFVRLRPDGTRIGDAVPALGSDVGHSGNLTVMAGPAAPRISPDGTRFAYWISARSLVTCPIWDPRCSFQDTDYTIVSRVDRFTPPEEFGAVRDYRDPTWAGDDRLFVTSYGLGLKEGSLAQVGRGEAGLLQWFDLPDGLPYLGQGELNRQGDKLAALAGSDPFGPGQGSFYLYGVTAGQATPPEPKCFIPQGAPPSGKFLIPSWSPDGTAVAVGQSDGIHVLANIPDLRAPNPDCGQITDGIVVKGSAPGWGPADVPGGAPAPAPAPPAGSPAAPAMADLVVRKRQAGRRVRVTLRMTAANATVRVRLLAKAGRRTMGSAVRPAATPGTVTVAVPLNGRGRTALRRHGRLRLTVRVAVSAPGAASAGAARRVTLRR